MTDSASQAMDQLDQARAEGSTTSRAATMDLVLGAVESLSDAVDIHTRRGRVTLTSRIIGDLARAGLLTKQDEDDFAGETPEQWLGRMYLQWAAAVQGGDVARLSQMAHRGINREYELRKQAAIVCRNTVSGSK